MVDLPSFRLLLFSNFSHNPCKMAAIKAKPFPESTVAVHKKAKRRMESSWLGRHKTKRAKQNTKENSELHNGHHPTSEEYGIILNHICLDLETKKKTKNCSSISVKQYAAEYLAEAPIDSKIKCIALGIVGNWTELRPMQSPESQEVIEL